MPDQSRRVWANLAPSILLASLLGLSACANQEAPPSIQPVQAPQPIVQAPKKLALLVPLTGPNANLGEALRRAATLALGGDGAPLLDVRDTGGDPTRAGAAAHDAIANGDALILGPLTAAETAVVTSTAQGTPVLAFTSDPAAASPGVWTLGLTPAQQIRRLVSALHDDGRAHIAAILPDGAFGDALAQSLTEAAADSGMAPPAIRRLTDDPGAFDSAIQDLADVASRHQAVKDRIEAAKSGTQSTEAAVEPAAPVPFDALVLAQPGASLDPVLQSLPGYDVVMPGVRLVGPAFWAGQAASHPRLAGAWYAAPDPAPLSVFAEAYAAKFGGQPPAFASIAFDAAAIGRVVAAQGEISAASLTRSEGFSGAGGLLQLLPDGHVRRALAIFESRPDGDRIVSPPPESLN